MTTPLRSAAVRSVHATSVRHNTSFVRTASAVWRGKLADGKGEFKTGSGKFASPYSVPSRFGNEAGTNPEELIAAAHSSCYAMAFSAALTQAGFEPVEIKATADVHLNKQASGWNIDTIALKMSAKVPKIDKTKFAQLAEEAKKGCPISKALAGPKITLEAKLE